MAVKNLVALLLAILQFLVFKPVMIRNEITQSQNYAVSASAGSLWESVCRENERCIAADSDGTNFLLLEDNFPEEALSILDIRTGRRTAVYFGSLTNAELMADSCMRSVLGSKITDAQKEAMLKKYGSAENLVAKLGWKGVKARAAGGGYFLAESGMLGLVRIDIRTGEALHLESCSQASLNRNGDLAIYFARERRFFIVPAGTAIPNEVQGDVPSNAQINAICLLSDGSVWTAESMMRSEKMTVNGKETLVFDVSFACYSADGREQRRVQVGCIRTGYQPAKLMYSEETDTMIASCANLGPVWIFGPEDNTAKVLAPQSLTPPTLKKADREETVDEVGVLLKNAWKLLPIGLSAVGDKLLAMDADSGYVFLADLNTLEAEIVLTYDQVSKLMEEKPNEFRGFVFIADMFWNGTNLLCNPAGGSMIRLPLGK